MAKQNVLIAITLLTLLASFLMKLPCVIHPWSDNFQYRSFCYNDIQALYGVRELDRATFPYVKSKSYEYPVVTGLTMWTASLAARDDAQFFLLNAAILAVLAIISSIALFQIVGWSYRLFWFAAGPPLVYYAFLNWDLIAVCALCLAMWSWTERRWLWTGFALAVGTSAKLFPAYALLPMMLFAWRAKEIQQTKLLLISFVATFAAINLPIIGADWVINGKMDGWTHIWTFHADRLPDFGTIWYWLPDAVIPAHTNSYEYRDFVDKASFLLFAGVTILALRNQYQKNADPFRTTAIIMATFLIVSKVHSPQYALWMTPFYVVTNIPWQIISLNLLFDTGIFLGGWLWLATDMSENIWKYLFITAVFGRASTLALMAMSYAFRTKNE